MAAMAAMTESQIEHAADPCGTLSAREREVLAMAALGLTNGKIAVQMHVTIHAVKFHLASIYRKLGVTNRTEAAFVYLRSRAGLVNEVDN